MATPPFCRQCDHRSYDLDEAGLCPPCAYHAEHGQICDFCGREGHGVQPTIGYVGLRQTLLLACEDVGACEARRMKGER